MRIALYVLAAIWAVAVVIYWVAAHCAGPDLWNEPTCPIKPSCDAEFLGARCDLVAGHAGHHYRYIDGEHDIAWYMADSEASL